MRSRAAAGIAAAFALAIAPPARAAIPSAAKVARAVAETNAASGRSSPLILYVRLRIEGGANTAAPSAEGELAVHPSGLARLELRNSWGGFVERHLLQSNTYQASRNGELIADPHPFLPPVFLLQASSGEGLAAALATFGVDSRQVVLGKMGTHDCYVLGGRAIGPAEATHPLPSLWVDATSLEPLRIVRTDGVEYRFGPAVEFEAIHVPSFIDVIAPDGLRARLEITRAKRAAAPAAEFQPSWLTAKPSAPSPR